MSDLFEGKHIIIDIDYPKTILPLSLCWECKAVLAVTLSIAYRTTEPARTAHNVGKIVITHSLLPDFNSQCQVQSTIMLAYLYARFFFRKVRRYAPLMTCIYYAIMKAVFR